MPVYLEYSPSSVPTSQDWGEYALGFGQEPDQYDATFQGDLECEGQSDDAPTVSMVARLADQWQEETACLSSPFQKMDNRNFQELVHLGNVAIPILLAQMIQKGPSDLFLVLQAITQEDPVHPDSFGDMDAIAAAWVEWGIGKGYLGH